MHRLQIFRGFSQSLQANVAVLPHVNYDWALENFSILLFIDHGTRRGEESASRPGRSLRPRKTRYPFYRRLGGPQGRSGQVRKIAENLASPGLRKLLSSPIYELHYLHSKTNKLGA